MTSCHFEIFQADELNVLDKKLKKKIYVTESKEV